MISLDATGGGSMFQPGITGHSRGWVPNPAKVHGARQRFGRRCCPQNPTVLSTRQVL